MTYDLRVVGGLVVDEHGSRPCNVYVRGGVVAAITAPEVLLPAQRHDDVSGMFVLPGVIDAHTHFRTYSAHCDDFGGLCMSASYGGITTLMAFVMGMGAPGTTLGQRIDHFMGEASGSAAIDYSFHAGLIEEENWLAGLEAAMGHGVMSFKMFMTYRDRGLMVGDDFMYRAMVEIAKRDGLAMVHAECGDIIDALGRRQLGGLSKPSAYGVSRPSWTEAEAARRAVVLGDKAECPVYFVHVSSEEALVVLLEARQRGQRVYIETCPQYLNLTDEVMDAQGALAKIAPPLRSASDVSALRRGLVSGDIDVVGSDHAPYTRSQKGDPEHFDEAPVGAPGTETLLRMTAKAVVEVGGSLSDLVRLTCGNPARIFGLADRKGSITVGGDADFTVVDGSRSSVVDGSRQHSSSDYSLFDGLSAPVDVKASYVRGRKLMGDGGNLGAVAEGEYLARRRSGTSVPGSWSK